MLYNKYLACCSESWKTFLTLTLLLTITLMLVVNCLPNTFFLVFMKYSAVLEYVTLKLWCDITNNAHKISGGLQFYASDTHASKTQKDMLSKCNAFKLEL